MSQRALFFFISSLLQMLLLTYTHAQTTAPANEEKEKNVMQKVDGYIQKGQQIYNQASPALNVLQSYLGGGTKEMMAALGQVGQARAHTAFPMCQVLDTIPKIPRSCQYEDHRNTIMASETTSNNTALISYLQALKSSYEMGKSSVDNHGNNLNGVACLKEQINVLNADFERINKNLDDDITKWKIITDKLIKDVRIQKEKLTDDYNLLYTGGNDKFNPIDDLLAQPGCDNMFEHDSITKSYLGQNADLKNGGLMGIRESEEKRAKNAIEFLKNAPLIQKDLSTTLNQLEMNLNNTSINELINNGSISESLRTSTTDLSQYTITNNPNFTNGIRTAITDMRSTRNGIINEFKGFLNANDSADASFLKSLAEAGDNVNKDSIFTSWQNKKKLNCIYQQVSSDSIEGFEAQLYALASPKDPKMRKTDLKFNCASNKSCKAFVSQVMLALNDDSSGEPLEKRISNINAVNNTSIENVYTFKTPDNSAARKTLKQLLNSFNTQCKKTMSLENQASYDHVVDKIMKPAIKKLKDQDKNLRKNIMARMRNELMECKGKGINHNSCSNVLPNDNAFCFKQASTCSQNINQCTQTLTLFINQAVGQIKINADNINAKVRQLKTDMHQNLISKMADISNTANLHLNIAALAKYAGYETKKNNFTIGTSNDEENPNAFMKGFEKLVEPPRNIKILRPENATELYAENIEMIKDQYSDMKKKIAAKMNEEIKLIASNYENSIDIIEAELKKCGEVIKTMKKEHGDYIEVCKTTGAKDKAQTLIEEILKNTEEYEDICKKDDDDLELKVTLDKEYKNWKNNKDAVKTYKKLIKSCGELTDNCGQKTKDTKPADLIYVECEKAEKNVTQGIEKLKAELIKSKSNEEASECIAVDTSINGKTPNVNRSKDPDKNNTKKTQTDVE